MPADKQPSPDALTLLDDLIARAKKAGADAADAVLFEGASISHAQRLGKLEKLERQPSLRCRNSCDRPKRRSGWRAKSLMLRSSRGLASLSSMASA